MKWFKDSTTRWYMLWGFVLGLISIALATVIAISENHLPWDFGSVLEAARMDPLLQLIYTAPLFLGFFVGMIGYQKGLSSMISRGKKEWEATFDSFTDLIFVTDSNERIIRCNRAVIDHLNTSYNNVIGKPISEILSLHEQDGDEGFKDNEKGFEWFGKLYDVSTFPVKLDGDEQKSIFILRDVTRRKQAEVALEQSETLFRGLFDLSPDAVIVVDPHDPNVSWPIVDCNKAACVMHGYQREELIGQSVDILSLAVGTPDERSAYLKPVREAGSLKLETRYRRKNGEVLLV